MECKFSVDDILGRLWKMSGEHGHGGESFLAMESSGFAEEIGKKMSRIDSVWAFQEFLKNHVMPSNSASVDKQEMGKPMSRIDSVWAFWEFLKSSALNDLGGAITLEEREEDADQNREEHLNTYSNANLGHSLTEAENDKHRDGANVLKSNPTLDFYKNGKSKSSPSQNSHQPLDLSTTESYLMVGEKRENTPNGFALSISPTKDGYSTTQINEFPEQQVSGALNPLFTGLQAESNNSSNRNPQEYEHFLKRQLDMACATVALTRVSFSLSC